MTVKGIDISEHQGKIDLSALKNQIDFCIVRLGYASKKDIYAEANIQQCENLGIPYGVYWYSYAKNADGALVEAKALVSALGSHKPTYPVWYDLEDKTGWLPYQNATALQAIAKTFCGYLEGLKFYVGLYASLSWFTGNLNGLDAYDKWVAQWDSKKCTYNKAYGMWQYTSDGHLDSYSGRLDMNIAYKDYPTIIKNAGLNGWAKTPTPTPTPTPSPVGSLVDGLQTVTYGGITYKVVHAPEGFGLRMMSATGEPYYTAVQDITQIDSDKLLVKAKVNANYFEMANSSYYGQHYGVEQSETLDLAPKQAGILAYAEKTDGTIVTCPSDQYTLTKAEVNFGCSPYAVRIHNGVLTFDRSTSFGDKDDIKNSQTAVFKTDRWNLAVTADGQKCCPRDITAMAQSFGATECIIMDSGGSTQMVCDAQKIVYTGRKIPNVLCLAKEVTAQTVTWGDCQTVSALKDTLIITAESYNLRDKIGGTVMKVLPKCGLVKLAGITDKPINGYYYGLTTDNLTIQIDETCMRYVI